MVRVKQEFEEGQVKNDRRLGMVVHICNPRTQKA
jgi:hypothetical protein